MDNQGSIVEFFFNIVPGGLFLFILKCLGFDIFVFMGLKGETLQLGGYIILSLFLGFSFQGITKLKRDNGWNETITKEVASKPENQKIFIEIYNNIHSAMYGKIEDIKEFKPTFYLMDCSLRGEKSAFLPIHFSSRFAFWANIHLASFILIFLVLLRIIYWIIIWRSISYIDFLFLSLLFLACISSVKLRDTHFEGYYDTIFKTYYMNRYRNAKCVISTKEV